MSSEKSKFILLSFLPIAHDESDTRETMSWSVTVYIYTNKLPLRKVVRPIRTENEVILFIILS